MFTFFEVGGKVRDEILGLASKDVDFVAVPNASLMNQSALEVFSQLEAFLKSEKFQIFLITSDCFTIRAMFPKGHKYSGVADFVMARKEIGYVEGTRNPIVVPGTLFDDLQRRDFTLNAMARDNDNKIIDFFGGMDDLNNRILRTPLDTGVTFNDDPLRIIRAIRFSVTKGFIIPQQMIDVIQDFDFDTKMTVVSSERIREEMQKCFKFDTAKTLSALFAFPSLMKHIFERDGLWLKPTFEH